MTTQCSSATVHSDQGEDDEVPLAHRFTRTSVKNPCLLLAFEHVGANTAGDFEFGLRLRHAPPVWHSRAGRTPQTKGLLQRAIHDCFLVVMKLLPGNFSGRRANSLPHT